MEKPFALKFASEDDERGFTGNRKYNTVNGGSVPSGTLLFGEDVVVFGTDEVEF